MKMCGKWQTGFSFLIFRNTGPVLYTAVRMSHWCLHHTNRCWGSIDFLESRSLYSLKYVRCIAIVFQDARAGVSNLFPYFGCTHLTWLNWTLPELDSLLSPTPLLVYTHMELKFSQGTPKPSPLPTTPQWSPLLCSFIYGDSPVISQFLHSYWRELYLTTSKLCPVLPLPSGPEHGVAHSQCTNKLLSVLA